MAVGKYDTHVKPKLLLVEAWARNGLTIDQIADNLGIARSTMFEYQKLHTDLSDALKKGKEVIDTMVENALLKAAMGYTADEHTYENGVLTKTVVKEMAPNTTALIFWLKNRNPKDWRDKQDIEHSGKMVMFSGESKLED